MVRTVPGFVSASSAVGMTPVAVFFGPGNTKAPGVEVDDPFFGGMGPRRRGCLECGECMTGCRHNAKESRSN